MISAKEAQKRTESFYHETFGVDLDRLIKDRSDEGHRTCEYPLEHDAMDLITYHGFITYLESHGYKVMGRYVPNKEIVFELKW